MAVNLSPVGGVAAQFFTNTGAVLTGGKIYTYAAGTTTPAATFTTSQGTTAWTNPIVLNAAGRVPDGGEIWLTDGINYKFLLKDSTDVLIATYDNISGINSNFVAFTNQQQIVTATANQTVFNLSIDYSPGTNSLSVFVDGVNQYGPGAQYAYTETDSNTVTFVSGLHVGAEVKFTTSQLQGGGAVDASQVSYQPPFTGGVATNVEAKLSQYVSVKDFGAVGDGTTDDAAAIQAAINSGAKAIFFPHGEYYVTTGLIIGGPVTLVGEGIQGAGNSVVEGSKISTDQNITLVTFDGSDGSNQGSGGGLIDMQLIQKKSGSGNQGIAVKITGTTTSLRANWIRIERCQVENYSGTYTWTKGIIIDGTPVGGSNGVRDMWISQTRVVAPGNAIELLNAFNVFIDHVECNLSGSNIVVSGTSGNISSSVFITNSTSDTFSIDYASFVYVIGGAFTSLTTTANTQKSNLQIGFLSSYPTPLAGSEVFLTAYHDVSDCIVSIASTATSHIFGRDSGAGDSTNITQIQVGNFGTNEGSLFTRYTNAAAAGSPTAGLYFLPRNNADSSNFSGGNARFEKISTLDKTNFVAENSEGVKIRLNGTTPQVDFIIPGDVTVGIFDDDATAGNTRLLLWDVDNNQLERVSVGAADSGGVGYKVLRIPN